MIAAEVQLLDTNSTFDMVVIINVVVGIPNEAGDVQTYLCPLQIIVAIGKLIINKHTAEPAKDNLPMVTSLFVCVVAPQHQERP